MEISVNAAVKAVGADALQRHTGDGERRARI
jgi:hypothetical protein